MEYINFNVDRQKLYYNQKRYFSTDTISTLYCKFGFAVDSSGNIRGEWNLPYHWAQFHDEKGNTYVKPVEDNVCSIPYDCLRQHEFKMTLFATDIKDYMVCNKRYTTNEISFTFNGLANLDYTGGVDPDEPVPSHWEVVLKRVDECEDKVDTLSQDVSEMGDKVDAFDGRVTANENDIEDLNTRLANEVTARTNDDADLQASINNRYTKAESDTLLDAKQDALSESQLATVNSGLTSTDKTTLDGLSQSVPTIEDRVNGIDSRVTTNTNAIDGVNTAVDNLNTELANESTSRANADARLERLISDESAARANADAAMQSAIQAEEKTRREEDVDESIALKMVINSVANIEFNRKDESHTVTLTNTASYPFNNSAKTIALDNTRSTNNYIVDANVISADGLPGEIVVFNKLINGFKVKYEGSAKSVTVKLNIAGGM